MDEIEVFLAVVEAGSQTAAARQLGRSLQSVNRTLAALERNVGVELVRSLRARRESVLEGVCARGRDVGGDDRAAGEGNLDADGISWLWQRIRPP